MLRKYYSIGRQTTSAGEAPRRFRARARAYLLHIYIRARGKLQSCKLLYTRTRASCELEKFLAQ